MTIKGGRRVAMAAAGLATVATPFVVGQTGAAAAESQAIAGGDLTFVATGGQTVTCHADLIVVHDTDDQTHPALAFNTFLSGAGPCLQDLRTTTTASYRDADGRAQTSVVTALETTAGRIGGAYGPTSVTTVVQYMSCDEAQSESCSLTLKASPK